MSLRDSLSNLDNWVSIAICRLRTFDCWEQGLPCKEAKWTSYSILFLEDCSGYQRKCILLFRSNLISFRASFIPWCFRVGLTSLLLLWSFLFKELLVCSHRLESVVINCSLVHNSACSSLFLLIFKGVLFL